MKETLELLLTPGILALGIAMLAIMFRMTHRRIDDLRSQMVSDHNHLSEKLDAVDKRLSESISSADKRLSEKIEAVDKRLSGMIDSLEQQIHGMNQRMDNLNNQFVTHLESQRFTDTHHRANGLR